MIMQQALEDFGVKLAFAEANILAANTPSDLDGTRNSKATSRQPNSARRQARRKAYIYGAFSLVLYAILFAKADAIMNTFTKGHFFAVLPVAAAFLFSYVHGTFTGSFWTAMGVNASNKATRKPTVEAPLTQRPTRRPRVHAQL